jgi:hypothetical protein
VSFGSFSVLANLSDDVPNKVSDKKGKKRGKKTGKKVCKLSLFKAKVPDLSVKFVPRTLHDNYDCLVGNPDRNSCECKSCDTIRRYYMGEMCSCTANRILSGYANLFFSEEFIYDIMG